MHDELERSESNRSVFFRPKCHVLHFLIFPSESNMFVDPSDDFLHTGSSVKRCKMQFTYVNAAGMLCLVSIEPNPNKTFAHESW